MHTDSHLGAIELTDFTYLNVFDRWKQTKQTEKAHTDIHKETMQNCTQIVLEVRIEPFKLLSFIFSDQVPAQGAHFGNTGNIP